MDFLSFVTWARRLFPRLFATVFAVALIAFPHASAALLSKAIEMRGAAVASRLQGVMHSMLERTEREARAARRMR
jgi:hypothetical protein